jgi:hypothetical protein
VKRYRFVHDKIEAHHQGNAIRCGCCDQKHIHIEIIAKDATIIEVSMDPTDAYDFAKDIIKCYDDLEGIS